MKLEAELQREREARKVAEATARRRQEALLAEAEEARARTTRLLEDGEREKLANQLAITTRETELASFSRKTLEDLHVSPYVSWTSFTPLEGL
jgi:hypothetical protein